MSNYRKTMTEALREMYPLNEGTIDKVKEIASKKQAMKIDGVMVDSFTASAISQIYDKVNDANKKKMDSLPIIKLANLAFKMMQKNEFVPEETDLDEGYLELTFKSKQDAEKAYNKINNEIFAAGSVPYDDMNQEGNEIQFDLDGNLNRRNDILKDLKSGGIKNFKVTANEDLDEARQLKDPENEIMVVKNGKVEVIDKKDKEKYMKKGYGLAEGKKYEHGIGKVNSAFEIGTPEYRQHTQSITPGQEITDYQRFKVESMKEALAKVWGLDEKLEEVEEKSLTKKVKGSTMTMTGKKSDEIDTKPEIDKEK